MLNNSIVIILKYSFQIDNSWIPINTTTRSYHQEFCTRFEDTNNLNLFHATFTIFNDTKYSNTSNFTHYSHNTPYLNPLKTIWIQNLQFLSAYINFQKSLLFKTYYITILKKKFQNCFSLRQDTLDVYFSTTT